MEEIKVFVGYREYKAALDSELEKSAEGFVRIGYLLRVAEDTSILEESGYKNVNEFAKAEYNLDASQVSRFININKKFSEGGYSDKLMDQYRGFGHAKLSLMLLLPDKVNEILTPSFSKSDIIEIKNEVQKESETSDLEVMMEGDAEGQQEMDLLHKVLHQLGHDDPELYRRLHVTAQRRQDPKGFADVLAPSGESVKTVRVQGTGRIMLAFKGPDVDAFMVNVRLNERENVSWQQLIGAFMDLMDLNVSSKESWEKQYREVLPETEKIAPVQDSPKVTKTPEKKASEKAPEKKSPDKETPKKKISEPKKEIPEPHQMHIEEVPEALPEGYIKSHDGSQIKENPEAKFWNEVEDLMAKLQTEVNAEEKDIDYMIQAAELLHMTLKEIKSVRTEHEVDKA